MKYLPHYHGPMPCDIPEAFGWSPPWWCPRCHGLEREPESVCTSRQTYDEPAEYNLECPHCGSTEVEESDGRRPLRAIRRRRIHSNHSMRIAA